VTLIVFTLTEHFTKFDIMFLVMLAAMIDADDLFCSKWKHHYGERWMQAKWMPQSYLRRSSSNF